MEEDDRRALNLQRWLLSEWSQRVTLEFARATVRYVDLTLEAARFTREILARAEASHPDSGAPNDKGPASSDVDPSMDT